jgi:hypothetical protein
MVERTADAATEQPEPGESQEAADAALISVYLLESIDDGKPFGFTWADVDDIMAAGDVCACEMIGPALETLSAVADLIAALLPPRNPPPELAP